MTLEVPIFIIMVISCLNFLLCRGSAIAKIVGNNAVELSDQFDKEVRMWVFEEMVDGQKLTKIINTKHQNVKYLPNIDLPENVVSCVCVCVCVCVRVCVCVDFWVWPKIVRFLVGVIGHVHSLITHF